MSNGETPGIGGYPDLAKPKTRYAQAYRHFWQVLAVDNRRTSRQTRQLVESVRASLRAHRAKGGH